MCGIVGYIGNEQAAPILLDGLRHLEYRGYDSAGLSVYDQGELNVVKAKGKLQGLIDLTANGKNVSGTVGLGHTRWATHGQPSTLNSHPHVSSSGRIAVVHNGIIENYMQLKDMLLGCGVAFTTETDTEVVAQLVEYYYTGDLLDAVAKTVARVEGSYALGIMCSDCPDLLVAARKDSPLILARSEGCSYLASDATALLKHTRDMCYLEDGDIALLTRESVAVYNSYLEPVERPFVTIDWDISAAEKGGYEHFMFKEIMEQPKVFKAAVSPRIRDGRVDLGELKISDEFIKNASRIFIIACGSAYHVGVIAKYNIERCVRKPVDAVLASEFRYCSPLVDEKSLVIVISQSGETLDTLAAMRKAKQLGGKTLAIVNVVGSTIAREADSVLYTWAGPEIAVATTKAYSAQLAVTYLLCLHLAELNGTMSAEDIARVVKELFKIPEKIQSILDNHELLQYFASIYFNNSSIFFIGRNLDYAISLEGSLKLKEISYIHSESYAAGELKHGPISLIEPGSLVVAICTYGELFDKTMSNIKEVKARGASVMCLSAEQQREKIERSDAKINSIFYVPDTEIMLLPSLAVVPLQIFAYYVALLRGCDIDKPRNLAKSVTVE